MMVMSIYFPVGLLLPVLAGAELVTGIGIIHEIYEYSQKLWSFVISGDFVDKNLLEDLKLKKVLVACFLFFFVFVSEDLSCISGGILAAAEIIPLDWAICACFLGILVSDFILYCLGRIFSKGVFLLPFIAPAFSSVSFRRIQRGYESNIFKLVFMTRFIPGSRVIAYVSAGVMRVDPLRFTGSLVVAILFWTPSLVGLAFVFGRPLIGWWESYGLVMLPIILLGLMGIYFGITVLRDSLSYRGRSRLRGRWLRLVRWEFWGIFPIYLPVFVYVCFLGLRYRNLMLWSNCNPGMTPLSGLILTSKIEILSALNTKTGSVADWCPIESGQIEDRLRQLNQFQADHGLSWPIVLKPHRGQRGEKVAIIRDPESAADYLSINGERMIAQRYIPGKEFGVFYYRFPGDSKGKILSITEKVLPTLIGDGVRSIERLILDDKRAVALAEHYLKVNEDRLEDIPAEGESIQLVELGTHRYGAVFLNGNQYKSESLVVALDELVSQYKGFYFGRFDIRASSSEALMVHSDFKVLELNGVASESTDIYDPKNSIFAAWIQLCRQWHLAFKIGAANRDAGASVPKLRELISVLRRSYTSGRGANSS